MPFVQLIGNKSKQHKNHPPSFDFLFQTTITGRFDSLYCRQIRTQKQIEQFKNWLNNNKKTLLHIVPRIPCLSVFILCVWLGSLSSHLFFSLHFHSGHCPALWGACYMDGMLHGLLFHMTHMPIYYEVLWVVEGSCAIEWCVCVCCIYFQFWNLLFIFSDFVFHRFNCRILRHNCFESRMIQPYGISVIQYTIYI